MSLLVVSADAYVAVSRWPTVTARSLNRSTDRGQRQRYHVLEDVAAGRVFPASEGELLERLGRRAPARTRTGR